ncbi:cupin domain-containing protein [Qipengyuania spongiae]|uniref:Cupin domain-containing protein n=1 Tax=Qipengyuania spongiae TaxID=2909673 RepID=A0ABY5T2C1_9SPHN|nr:cupin domain-containing protein [Qipengyuania spongiae]UVI40720.1 cupin domain-containing protein [Qipengyuania spongiae]
MTEPERRTGEARRLANSFVHLGLGASAVPQPGFSGLEWYADYGARHGADGREGRLVSQHSFTESWDSWEMHPAGSEVVICTEGEMRLIQEFPDRHCEEVALATGEYAINPPGVWHTADIEGPATAIFITAGEGTEHRPR